MATQNMNPKQIRQLIIFGVLFAAGVFLAIRFISAIVEVLVLFSLVALIVIVLTPPVGWLERHKIPRPASAAIIALLVLAIVGLLAWLAIPLLVREARSLVSRIPSYASEASRFLAPSGSHPFPVKAAKISDMAVSKLGSVLSRIGSYTLGFAELVGSALVVFISVVYTLSSPRPIAEGLLRLLQPDQAERFTATMQKISGQMRQWAVSVLAGMAVVFVLVWILLGPILHVQYAFVLAFTAGVLEIVPTLGPILSAIPPTLIALSVDPMKALWVLVGFVVVQQIESHLIIPLILGRGVRLHPVSVVFAVVVMAWLLGLVGIFLAVPLCAVAKTLIEELYIAPRETRSKEEVSEHVEQIVSGPSEADESEH